MKSKATHCKTCGDLLTEENECFHPYRRDGKMNFWRRIQCRSCHLESLRKYNTSRVTKPMTADEFEQSQEL